jgi:fido (protein-threonine AMPylation protein)
MTFDPFGDFATQGYLRNHAAQKAPAKVKHLEHDSFRANVGHALQALAAKDDLTFEDVKEVHKTLFEEVYPWAGRDRSENAREIHVTKGSVEFMIATHVGRGVEYALQQGNDVATMRAKPGEVIGHLAYAHPFLDGNGRTIMTVHSELCRRAGIHIDWRQTEKADYLKALTAEIDAPGKGHLDAYLKPFVREGALQLGAISADLQQLAGLGPASLAGNSAEPEIMIPSMTLSPEVSHKELLDRLALSRSALKSNEGLERMAALVFTNPKPIVALVKQAAERGQLDDRGIAGELRDNSDKFGKLAGKGGMFAGREERQAHMKAIAGKANLRSAADMHISVVHGIRKTMAQERHSVVAQAKVEVKAPSQSLLAAIGEANPLGDAHKAELKQIMSALEARFGGDLRTIRGSRALEELSQKHGLDVKQVERVKSTLKILDKGETLVRQEVRRIEKYQTKGREGPIR